jgi:hypothetical protein
MAYVPGYHQDVFISYAHVDNERMNFGDGDAIAWVTEFMKELKLRMNQNIDRPGVEIWMDCIALPGSEPVTKTLEAAVRNTATMIVMLSTGYLNSDWCQKEVQDFVNTAEAEGRLFVVHLENIPREERPNAMRDLNGFRFFDKERKNVALSPKAPDFYTSLLDLRDELSKKLNELRHQNSSRKDDPLGDHLNAGENPMSILLAEGTPDQSEDLRSIRVYLTTLGYKVLPERPYRRGRQEFQEMLKQDIAEARLFVQLLGQFGTERTEDFPEGYEGLQLKMAKDANLPMIRSYKREAFDFNKVLNSEHLSFLQENDVMALDLEELKSKVKSSLEEITLRENRPSDMEDSDKPIIIYVHEKDLKSAQQIGSRLDKRNLPWQIYLSNEDLERQTKSLNPAGLVLVYGEASEGLWVRDQVKKFRNVSLSKRPIEPVCALYFDPPEKRNEMLTSIPNYFIPLDSSSAEDVFQKFVGELVKVRAKLTTS